jgi:hypothetical protein
MTSGRLLKAVGAGSPLTVVDTRLGAACAVARGLANSSIKAAVAKAAGCATRLIKKKTFMRVSEFMKKANPFQQTLLV